MITSVEQYHKKIKLNSEYYPLAANKYFVLYDPNVAASITQTGRETIEKLEDTINKKLQD